MGKHGHRRQGASRGVVVAVLGIALVVAGGFTARALIADTGSGGQAASSDTSTASRTTSSSTTSSATASSSPTASPSTTAAPKAPAALAACVRQTAAGDKLVAAAKHSVRDWRIHTGAQKKLDSGEYSLQQTKDAWAASKARGSDDLAGVTKANRTYKKVRGGCSDLRKADVPETYVDAADACLKRDKLTRAAIKDGLEVNKEWAAHIDMMANKDNMDAWTYHEKWLAMVAQAQQSLSAWDSSARRHSKAPTCTVPEA